MHAFRHSLSRTAEADKTDHIVTYAVQRPMTPIVLPFSRFPYIMLVFRNAAQQRQHHSARMICNIFNTIEWIIDDSNALAGRSCQIDIIIM